MSSRNEQSARSRGRDIDEETITFSANSTIFHWLGKRKDLCIEGRKRNLKEKENGESFEEEIKKMREVLEYVKMEFRTEPAHIELVDDESFVDFMIGFFNLMQKVQCF